MDEMNGIALLAEIQKQHLGIRVIILTAHGSLIPDAVAASQREGYRIFLLSSVDSDMLYKVISEVLTM